jgi:hypothetical protein
MVPKVCPPIMVWFKIDSWIKTDLISLALEVRRYGTPVPFVLERVVQRIEMSVIYIRRRARPVRAYGPTFGAGECSIYEYKYYIINS